MVYHPEYDGYYIMKWHDDETNALKRWFDNYKIDKNACFATEYECLIVKEIDSDCKRNRKRLICQIEDEGRKTSREVIMDHTTPPAPMLTFAAKRRWEPPPPKSPASLRKEAEFERMYRAGYEPRYYRVPIYRTAFASFAPMSAEVCATDSTFSYEEKIEWVPRKRLYDDRLLAMQYMIQQAPMKLAASDIRELTQMAPPTPAHRRNV